MILPRGHPGGLGGLRLCLVQCVCACRDGDPCPRGESGWWQRRGFPAPKTPLSPFQVWGGPKGVSFACAQLQLVPCRREGGCLPSFLGSVLLSVCLSVCANPTPTPPCVGVPQGVWHRTLANTLSVFISHCTTGTVMPNKTAMGSRGVAVFGALVRGRMVGGSWWESR